MGAEVAIAKERREERRLAEEERRLAEDARVKEELIRSWLGRVRSWCKHMMGSHIIRLLESNVSSASMRNANQLGQQDPTPRDDQDCDIGEDLGCSIVPTNSRMVSALFHGEPVNQSAVAKCARALLRNPTLQNLRKGYELVLGSKSLTRRTGELEKTLSHPITFLIIEAMREHGLLPPELVWLSEPLTARAESCKELAGKSERNIPERLKKLVLGGKCCRPEDRESALPYLKDATRVPDGIFYLPMDGSSCHSSECAQRTAKLTVELKKQVKRNTVTELKAILQGAQRDFASTHPVGGAHFTLGGDGTRFCFLATEVDELRTRTRVSLLSDTKDEEGMSSFLTAFVTVLRASVHRPHEAAFGTPRGELDYQHYQFLKPLAVNSNSIVAQFRDTKKNELLVMKFDRKSGRHSIQDERSIMRHLVDKGLDRFVTPFRDGLEAHPVAIMQYGGE